MPNTMPCDDAREADVTRRDDKKKKTRTKCSTIQCSCSFRISQSGRLSTVPGRFECRSSDTPEGAVRFLDDSTTTTTLEDSIFVDHTDDSDSARHSAALHLHRMHRRPRQVVAQAQSMSVIITLALYVFGLVCNKKNTFMYMQYKMSPSNVTLFSLSFSQDVFMSFFSRFSKISRCKRVSRNL